MQEASSLAAAFRTFQLTSSSSLYSSSSLSLGTGRRRIGWRVGSSRHGRCPPPLRPMRLARLVRTHTHICQVPRPNPPNLGPSSPFSLPHKDSPKISLPILQVGLGVGLRKTLLVLAILLHGLRLVVVVGHLIVGVIPASTRKSAGPCLGRGTIAR